MKHQTLALLLPYILAVVTGCGSPSRTKGSAVLENVTSTNAAQDREPIRSTGWSSAGKTAAVRTALSLFDRNMNAVIAVDIAAIAKSQLYDEYRPFIDNKLFAVDGDLQALRELRDACGFHPLTEVETIVLGGTANEDLKFEDQSALFVVQGLTRARFVQCSDAMSTRHGGETQERGDFTRITSRRGETRWVYWLDDNTMALAPKWDREDWRARLRDGSDQRGHPDLLDILQKIEQDSALWIAFRPTGGLNIPRGTPLALPDITYTATYGWVQLDDGVQMRAAMRTGNEEHARALNEVMVKKVDEARPMFEMIGMGQAARKIVLDSAEADVSLSLSLTMDEVKQLVQIMKDFT